MHGWVRWLTARLVRLYYPSLSCEGLERLPKGVPLVFLPNHPNALLDPLVLRLAVGMPVAFLAKSTLFDSAISRVALDAYDAMPVYRQRDGGAGDKNEATFARCRARLGTGLPLAIFPEGTSHSDPTLKPLKTGAARIALGAEAEHGFSLGVLLVPASLHYDDTATFRSSALVVLGEPIGVAELRDDYEKDERATVHALTERVRAQMDEVVAQAETREILHGVARVAEWTAGPDAGPASRQARTLMLLRAYRAWSIKDPERTARVTQKARSYTRMLRMLGVKDPWDVEIGSISAATAVRVTFKLLGLAPFALVGALAGWLPYRFTGRVAARVTKDEDVLGTVKLLGGALFLALAWSAESALVGYLFGMWFAPLAFVAFMACGYAALRWDEIASESIEALRMMVFRNRADVSAALTKRRRELALEVDEALASRDSLENARVLT